MPLVKWWAAARQMQSSCYDPRCSLYVLGSSDGWPRCLFKEIHNLTAVSTGLPNCSASAHESLSTRLSADPPLMFRQFSLNKAAFIVVPVISAFSPNIPSRVCGSGRLQPCAFFCLVWRNGLGWDVFVWDRADSLLAVVERGGTHRESDSLNKLSSRTACFPFALLCWTQTKGVCWTSKYFCLKPR